MLATSISGSKGKTHLLANGIRRGGGVGSRDSGNDGAVGHAEARDAVDGEGRVDDAALLAGKHGGGAAWVHQRLDDVVLDVLDQGLVVSDIGAGGDLDGTERLPGIGGVDAAEVVGIRDHDVQVDGVGTGGVVDDGSGIVVLRVEDDGATAERLQEEAESRAGVERRLEDGVLGVLEGLGDDLQLGKVALLDGLASSGREVVKGGAVGDLGADVGNDLLPLGRDVLQGDVGSAVTHGKGVGATGGALAELGDGLGGVGLVVQDQGLVGERSVEGESVGGAAVVLEVLANTGEILDDGDALRGEVLGRGDTAALEDLRGVNGTGRQDNLKLGADGLDLTAGNGAELDGRDCLVLADDETGDLVLDEEVEVGARVGDPGVVADSSVGALDSVGVLSRGNPADTVLVAVVASDGGLEAELLVCLPSDL